MTRNETVKLTTLALVLIIFTIKYRIFSVLNKIFIFILIFKITKKMQMELCYFKVTTRKFGLIVSFLMI